MTNNEQAVLASILMDNRAIATAQEHITHRDFESEAHQIIFRNIHQLHSKGVDVNIMSLVTELEKEKTIDKVGGASYIGDLLSLMPSSSGIAYFAKEVKRTAVQRTLKTIGSEIQGISEDNMKSPDELISEVMNKVLGVDSDYVNRKSIAEFLTENDEFMQRIKKAESEGKNYIGYSSGIEKYDKATKGLYDGRTYVIGAAAGTGKTYFAINMIAPIIQSGGYPIFISIEQTGRAIISRAVNSMKNHGIEPSMIVSDEAMGIIDSMSNIDQIVSMMHSEKMQRSNCVFILDYIQLVESGDKTEYERISNNMRKLRDTAKTLNTPLVILSQMNREHVKFGKAGDAGFKGSGAIMEYGDVNTELRFDSDSNFQERTEMMKKGMDVTVNCVIVKNKEGHGGTVALNFNGKQGTFKQQSQVQVIDKQITYDIK